MHVIGTAGHVDDSDFVTRGQREPGETQVDCESSPFLLFEPIRIDAGQTLNES